MNNNMDKVLCLIQTKIIDPDEQDVWMDLEPENRFIRKEEFVLPLYNHAHSDKENDQEEVHYHIDGRYIKDYPLEFRISLPLKENSRLEYRMLNKIRNTEPFITTPKLISKSKLKHNCIHKGKCPHRGYDLSNEKPNENGIITCPLHGLRFNTKDNNKIINFDK